MTPRLGDERYSFRTITLRTKQTGGSQWPPPALESLAAYLMLLFSVRSNESLPMTVAPHHFEVAVPLVTPLGSLVRAKQFAEDRFRSEERRVGEERRCGCTASRS